MDLPTHSDKKSFWRQLEDGETNAILPTEQVINMLCFNDAGLLPVITQCADTGKVLMLAWMNKDALCQTLKKGMMVYYSRSRQTLWEKGETSGCRQQLCRLAVDCDGDTLLATVKQTGAACHTGRVSCFYLTVGQKQTTRHE